MLKNSTRRWLAGLGVAGAFIAASATPASAEENADDTFLYANNALIAPGGEEKSVMLYALTDALPEQLSVTVDRTAVKDFATVSLADRLPGCTEAGTLITCNLKGADTIDYVLNLTVKATDSAKAGDTGELTFTLAAEGEKTIRTTSTVEVGEGIDLKASDRLQLSGAPGSTVEAPLGITNIGDTTARDTVLLLVSTTAVAPAQRYSNCSYLSAFGTNWARCELSEEIAPGSALQLDASSALKIAPDAWAPGQQFGAAWWFASGDWAEFLADFPVPADEWEKGSGKALTLEPTTPSVARQLRQTDTDSTNNTTEILVAVTGDQRADVAANGTEVAGSAGGKVSAKVGFTNNGPAMINSYSPGELVTAAKITIPAGATVVVAPVECSPGKAGEKTGGYGEPGGRVYFCEWYDVLHKGESAVFEFGLRMDGAGGAAGSVELLHFDLMGDGPVTDLNPKNDTAPFVIKGATGGGGGGDGGSLPITGASTGLIAGLGGLLLAAGVGGYLVAKRRRTRFVA